MFLRKLSYVSLVFCLFLNTSLNNAAQSTSQKWDGILNVFDGAFMPSSPQNSSDFLLAFPPLLTPPSFAEHEDVAGHSAPIVDLQSQHLPHNHLLLPPMGAVFDEIPHQLISLNQLFAMEKFYIEHCRKIQCPSCPKAFRSFDKLRNHFALYKIDFPYYCEPCHQIFKTPAGARRHCTCFYHKANVNFNKLKASYRTTRR